MPARDFGHVGAWSGHQDTRGCGSKRRRVLIGGLAIVVALAVGGEPDVERAAAQANCQTPFLVFTDPANPGTTSQSGDVAVTRDSGLLGDYRGDGRFAGYTIAGAQDAIVNTASGMARVQGQFVATSPGGGSSITVSYTGQVDFGAGMARGNFVVVGGTGDDASYRASGTIEGTVIAPATLDGVDIGLC